MAITLKTATFDFVLWKLWSLTISPRNSLSMKMWLSVQKRTQNVLSSYGQTSDTCKHDTCLLLFLTGCPGSQLCHLLP